MSVDRKHATEQVAGGAVAVSDSNGNVGSSAGSNTGSGSGNGSNSSSGDDDPVMSIVYCPGGILPKLVQYVGRTIEIRINAKFLTNKNKEVQTQQIWGTDIYTDDSDAVAILLHTGQIVLRSNPPGTGIAAIFRVMPPDCRPGYAATTRYNFKSRSWASKYPRTSLKLVKCDRVENTLINSVYAIKPTVVRCKPGATTAASAVANGTTNGSSGSSSSSSSSSSSLTVAMDEGSSSSSSHAGAGSALNSSSAAPVTLVSASSLIAADKQKEVKLHKMTATERSAAAMEAAPNPKQPAHAHSALKLKRKMSDATIVYNAANEPCLKYSLGLLIDRAYVDDTEWTAARLKRETVYFERNDTPLPIRFELAREPQPTDSGNAVAAAGAFDTYRWSQVTSTLWTNYDLPTKTKKRKSDGPSSAVTASAAATVAVPKKETELKVLERGLDWEQLEWGPTSVRIRGREYTLDSLLWKPNYPPPPPPPIPVSPSAITAAASGAPAPSPSASPTSNTSGSESATPNAKA